MVFYYLSEHDGEKYILYMGEDKHENEELIRHAFGNDLWFHVNDMSSAHVYLRFPRDHPGDLDKIHPQVLSDCCQLVKQNSIKGCKEPSVKIVYTPWTNLKKDGSMAVGQVGFHSSKMLRYHVVHGKDRDALTRLKKTMVEKPTSIILEQKLAYQRRLARVAKREKQQHAEEEQQRREEAKRQAEIQKAKEEADRLEMQSNVDLKGMTAEDYEDDFM